MVVPVGEGYSRFSAEPLEKALKKIVFDETHNEDTPLADERDQICPVFVLSTRGKDAGPVKLFRSYGFYKDECPIWQAARATTAAPTYFPPAWVTVPYPPESYVDGGVTQNNPSPLALKEGRDMWKAKRCILVSVGTGIQKRADLVGNQRTPQDDLELMDDSLTSSSQLESGHTPENISSPGSTNRHRLKGGMKLGLGKAATMVGGAFQEFASTIRPMTDKVAEFGRFPGGLSTAVQFLKELVKLSTQSEKTHGEVYAEAHSRDLSAQFPYYRFNVQNGLDDIGLEEWQNWNLMVSLTRNYLDSADVSPRLTECAGDLLHPPRFVSM